MMKAIFTILVFAATLMTATAQSVTSTAALNAQRVEDAVLTPAQKKQAKAAAKAAQKSAKAEAKNMKQDGWQPAPATEDLVTQLTERNIRRNTRWGNAPAYFVATTTAHGGSYGVARKQAIARCRSEIAQSIRADIAALIEVAEQNAELTAGQHETVAKFSETGMQHYEQSIGRTEVVLEAVRERNSSTEVLISLSLDARQVLESVFNTLEEVDANAASKLREGLR